jgi:threonine/homoserine/homoserine lactone efflux protein
VTDSAHLWVFFLLVLGTVMLPGLDMAFVLGSALVGGRRAGLWAVTGLMAGGACHVAMGATGLAVVLRLFPSAFNAMLVAGAVYVAWVGFGLWGTGDGLPIEAGQAERSSFAFFRRAALTNLLNPKAYVFMLAVFPQFIRPESGPVAGQALVLGAIIVSTQGVVYGTVACAADWARDWLRTHPGGSRAMARGVGLLLMAVAAFTVLEGWRMASR